jgi:voltage-gated potassium channel
MRVRELRLALRTRQELKVLLFVVAFIVFATVGFWIVESDRHPEYELVDGLWWAVVTMTTVGYGDISPETTAGRFLIAFPAMLAGGGVIAYGLSVVTTWLLEERTKEARGMNALSLEDHVLLINYPGPKKTLDMINELRSEATHSRREVVLLTDALEQIPDDLARAHVRFVRGSPINEDALARACVTKAARIIVFAKAERDENSDSTNLGVVVGLRASDTTAHIVVEVVAPSHKDLMLKAGADLAVCVTELSTLLLAQASQGDGMQELFADLASNRTPQQVDAVPLRLDGDGRAKFGEVGDHLAKDNMILIGVRRGDRQLVNPGRAFDLSRDDKLLVISSGHPAEIRWPA